jgi:hypothetical protein
MSGIELERSRCDYREHSRSEHMHNFGIAYRLCSMGIRCESKAGEMVDQLFELHCQIAS